MIVYRLLCEEELETILKKRTESIGRQFIRNKGNTHKYKSGEKYMHFFFKREDCEYMRKFQLKYSKGEKNFIAKFNIPLKRIIGHIGKGFYESKISGFDCDYDARYELAIPVSIFKPEWLKSYEQVSLAEEIQKSRQPS